MQSGWVIVYLPGGDIYQLLAPSDSEPGKTSINKRILKGAVKTFLTCVQLYWWIRS